MNTPSKHLKVKDANGKSTLTKLPPPSDVVPYDKRELMSKRCKNVVDMPDMGRKYTDIITDRGHWVMENWLHWAETMHLLLLTKS